MHHSNRTSSSKPNPIARAQSLAGKRGIRLRNLNDSNPTHFGLAPDCLPGIYDADPRGPYQIRLSLAQFLDGQNKLYSSTNHVDPDDLYLVTSTSQGYSWLMKLLCDAGDIILEPRPGYPLIESIAGLECTQVLPYHLVYDGSWWMNLAEIRQILEGPAGGRIRALIVINPNNPTGSYLHPTERAELLDLCMKHGVAIIADEVFFDYPLDPLPGRRHLSDQNQILTFTLDGFSKKLAAPHAKVGWIQVSGPAHLVAEAKQELDCIADDYLPMSQIVTDAIPDMLQDVPGQLDQVGRRIRTNWSYLLQFLKDHQTSLSLLRAEGGWSVLLRFPEVIDEDELILHLMKKYRVSGQPGYFFDMPANGYLALSLLPEPLEFQANVRIVSRAIEDFLGTTLAST